jgi:hypothetical protein
MATTCVLSRRQESTGREMDRSPRHGDRRIVFWDDTNVDMPKASNGELQRMSLVSEEGRHKEIAYYFRSGQYLPGPRRN